MRTTHAALLLMLGGGLAWLADASAGAAETTAKNAGEPASGGLLGALGAVSKAPLPSLSGLIRPEKMGLLTDNQPRFKDNETHLLSDNDTEVELQAENRINILSGIQLFSGIKVNVQINVSDGGSKAAKASKGDGERKAKKPHQRKAARKPPRA